MQKLTRVDQRRDVHLQGSSITISRGVSVVLEDWHINDFKKLVWNIND